MSETLGGSVRLTEPTRASKQGGGRRLIPPMRGDGTAAYGGYTAEEDTGEVRPRRTRAPRRKIDRWRKRNLREAQENEESFDFGKFLELFEQIKLTDPIADIKLHREKFEEFISQICKGKRKMEELDGVTSLEECLEVMSRDLPKKYDDPGSISIPITIRNHTHHNALVDSGSSDNILPTEIYLKLNLKEKLEPATSTLEFADSSNKKPRGIVRNVLIKVMQLKYLADFTILDMERRENPPIILGRPFLRTAEAILDMKQRGIILVNGNRRIQIFDKHKQVNEEHNEVPKNQKLEHKKEGKRLYEPP